MNITQLKYFYEVCRFQSVSLAAEYLYISQPTVSNAIKELENEFGVSLFRRHRRGVILTEEGETFLNLCKDILNRTECAENIMKDLGNCRKKLRLGVPPMIGSIILPHIYRDFLSHNEDISLEVTESGSHELTRMLSNDYIDMIFLPYNSSFEAGWDSKTVARLEMVCVASRESEISKRGYVSPKTLKDVPQVLFDNMFFQTDKITKWFETENVTPRVILQTKQLSTVMSIVSNNIATGFMFRKIAETNDDIVAVPLKNPIYEDISIVWKSNAYRTDCMDRFKDYITTNNPFHK